jgi:hypothetical protein
MPVLIALLVIAGGSVSRAKVARHKPKRPSALVLHPKWRVLAPSGVERVLVSGRYVFIGKATGSGVVSDEQTGKRVVLTPPAGCDFDFSSAALGGSSVVATCNPPPPGPRYLYELYSIPNGTWTPFTPNVTQMFAFNAACETGNPTVVGCSASYTAIGAHWIEFQITCGYHCGPTTFGFQNIETGQVDDQPPDWKPGGTEMPDLNSATLTRKLCKPLRVPRGFSDPTAAGTMPGTIVLDGPFAVAQQWSTDNLYLSTYLERCASGLRKSIDPNGWPIAANARAVIWMKGYSDPTLDGLFLRTLRRFTLTRPPTTSLAALSAKHLYAVTPDGRLYAAAAPAQLKP